jgi:hypothetical protein
MTSTTLSSSLPPPAEAARDRCPAAARHMGLRKDRSADQYSSSVTVHCTRPVVRFDPVAVHHDMLKYLTSHFLIKSSDHKMMNTIYLWMTVLDQCADLLRGSLGKRNSLLTAKSECRAISLAGFTGARPPRGAVAIGEPVLLVPPVGCLPFCHSDVRVICPTSHLQRPDTGDLKSGERPASFVP